MKLTIRALALLLLTSPAVATPPPPSGYYGAFRLPQINCPTEAAALSVFAAMTHAAPAESVVPKALAEFKCVIDYVGVAAVGESTKLGAVQGANGPVTFYSVHVGTIDREWWLLYADRHETPQ